MRKFLVLGVFHPILQLGTGGEGEGVPGAALVPMWGKQDHDDLGTAIGLVAACRALVWFDGDMEGGGRGERLVPRAGTHNGLSALLNTQQDVPGGGEGTGGFGAISSTSNQLSRSHRGCGGLIDRDLHEKKKSPC